MERLTDFVILVFSLKVFVLRIDKHNIYYIPNPILYFTSNESWLCGPQKFVIMIRCKINFDMIWYSVIFAANLYLSIFVWSSDTLNFVFMNDVILVFALIAKCKWNLHQNTCKKIRFCAMICNDQKLIKI